MAGNLSGPQGRRQFSVLPRTLVSRALVGGSALAIGTALACTGAASAGAATSARSVMPASPRAIGHVMAAVDDDFPADDIQIMSFSGRGLCLDAENDSGGSPSDNGDKVQLWTCNGGATQQRWDIEFGVGQTGQIVNEGGGLCLDAETDSGGNPSDNGDKVQLWACNIGASQQQWFLSQLADGSYEFTSSYAGLVLAAESDSGGDPADCGDLIQVQDWTSASSQTWSPTTAQGQCD